MRPISAQAGASCTMQMRAEFQPSWTILADSMCVARWTSEGHEVPESVRDFRPSQFYAGYQYLENYLVSSLNDYCKRKKTPKIGYLDSSRPVLP